MYIRAERSAGGPSLVHICARNCRVAIKKSYVSHANASWVDSNLATDRRPRRWLSISCVWRRHRNISNALSHQHKHSMHCSNSSSSSYLYTRTVYHTQCQSDSQTRLSLSWSRPAASTRLNIELMHYKPNTPFLTYRSFKRRLKMSFPISWPFRTNFLTSSFVLSFRWLASLCYSHT